jgi:outer membrane receptor protein involved in Fe transport
MIMRATRTPPGSRAARTVHLELAMTVAGMLSLALGAAAPRSAAAAETEVAPQLEEVVVTATRREESLSRVPVSVTAITQEGLDVRGIKDIQDVARFTPGINVDISGTNNVSIRGIASSGGSGTTGIYIDDTPIQMRGLAFNPDEAVPKSFDIDRIEVLRGPQGTLFGAGSEGGTVRYITAQPSLTKSSVYSREELSFTSGGDASYEAGVAAGGPIVDGKFGGRVAVWYRRDGGWIDRVDPSAADPTHSVVESNSNHAETLLVRLAGIWAPSSDWTVTPVLFYQDRKENDVSNYWVSHSSGSNFISGNPTRTPTPDKFYLPTIKIEGKFDAFTLISNTSYFHREEQTGYDGTIYNLGFYQSQSTYPVFALPWASGATYPMLDDNGMHMPAGLENYRSPATIDNNQQNFTQEIRLQSTDSAAKLRWTTGVFYTSNRQQYLEQIHDPMLPQLALAVTGIPYVDLTDGCSGVFYDVNCNPVNYDPMYPQDSYFLKSRAKDEQYAWFGEANYSLTDRLTLTAGARYSSIKFSLDSITGGPQLYNATLPSSVSSSETAFTPKVTLAFQATPQDMFYATYAKGYRPGGGNNPVPFKACQDDLTMMGFPNGAPTKYDSDTVNSFEVGAKNNFNNRVRLAASVFYIKWNNIQQLLVPPICQISFVTNLGEAVAKGADFQADVAITDALSLELTAGYTSARYTKTLYVAYLPDGTPDPSVLPLVRSGDAVEGTTSFSGHLRTPAPFTSALGLQYKFGAFGHDSFVRLDWEYEGRAKWLPASQDPGTQQYDSVNFTVPETNFLSMRAGTKLGGWSAELFVDNLTDTHPITAYEYTINPDPQGLSPNPLPPRMLRANTFRPRTYGLTFTYRR